MGLSDAMGKSILALENLEIGYGGRPILPAISFHLAPGTVTTIVGHNGSGKSSLLKTILGLSPKIRGKVELAAGTRIGYVPQREAMDPIYPVRVGELVETGRYGHKGTGGFLKNEDYAAIDAALTATGVARLRERLFRTLSGGEQQRVLLARALCTEPTILVLDEPTASMDERGATEAMRLTLELAKKRDAAILMVNHFLDLVREVSDQVVLLDRDYGSVQVGEPAELLKHRGRAHGG